MSFLDRLIEKLDDTNTVGILLTGSFARGDDTQHSDIDLIRFVTTPPRDEAEHYTVAYVDDRLVSITTTTIAAKRDEMATPDKAIWSCGNFG